MSSIKKIFLLMLPICLAIPALAEPTSVRTENEIVRFYDEFQKAISADSFATDPAPALAFFDEKRIRLFDLGLPEEFDAKTFRDHFITTSKMMPTKTTIEALKIYSDGGRIAFVSYIQHTVGRMGPRSFDIRIRAVDGLEKENGKWLIVNENLSLPLDDKMLGAVIFGDKSP